MMGRTFIAHIDLPAELHLRHQEGTENVLATRYLPRFRAAGICAVIGAVFVHPAHLPELALSMALEQIAALYAELNTCSDFRLVRSGAELEAALAADKIAILLSLEGSQPLRESKTLLQIFHTLGVRLLGLTWNGRTMAADGCAVPGAGLTEAGRALVCAAWEQGMILDVSHLNDAGVADVLSMEGGGIIASHSNCRALCSHPRNLTDAQIRALAARGGIIGVNQVRFLVKSGGATLDALAAHILHLSHLAGTAHVGLGLDLARDYMDALPKPRTFWETWNPADEDLLTDYTDLSLLRRILRQGGLSEAELRGIWGGNFLTYLKNTLN